MTRAVQVSLNGRPQVVPDGTTVSELIISRGLDPRYVIVERNGDPVERGRYEAVRLEEGDRLELVRAVAGG